MEHFLYRLIPPRPTFPADATDAENRIMEAHFGYWTGLINERKVVAYGPVMDPRGTYGVAILEVPDAAAAQAIADGDPAVRSDAGFGSELHPMGDTVVRT
ncbi:YciI family protein [Georgenia daeguensis]|uniref:YCII-related domain-containing protein n=1 Tax=Georgenia daeguensis TaxID=908355 RepID=A0ABP8EVG1_9MICO